MKWRSLIVWVSMALAANVCAEDKVSADIEGTVAVDGITSDGIIVGDLMFAAHAQYPVSGKVSVVTKDGGVHRIETYTDWNAGNGVHAYVWEKLYVSGGTYTGWSERLIQTPFNVIFSRTVIDGSIDQKIRPDGSGYAGWTVAGSDNGVDQSGSDSSDNSDSATDAASSTSTGDDLPVVDIMEEGEFDGVSERRIEISPSGDGHPTLTFRDYGYTRADLSNTDAGHPMTINQRLDLDGKGKGSIAYIPREEPDASATPTPTPTPGVTPTPTPTPGVTPTPTPTNFFNPTGSVGTFGNTDNTDDSGFDF